MQIDAPIRNVCQLAGARLGPEKKSATQPCTPLSATLNDPFKLFYLHSPMTLSVSLVALHNALLFSPQVCGIASNIFGSWIGDSTWLNHIIVNHINTSVVELTGYELDGDSVEDIGYVQVIT